jgi:tRNA A-37 threonylcarbamoyl transferase component Bud32
VKYEVRDKLGHGGYGIVYAARDTELGRDVALKILRPEYVAKPQVVQRFLQEARAVAKIVHPGIVTVYECGHVEGTNTPSDGSVFIAMELLAGVSLASRLDQADGKPLDIETVIELGTQMAAALEAAHRKGIVHRDLKPDNVFLVPDNSVDGGERVKILDFGVAKLADHEVGRVTTVTDANATGVHTHSMMMLGTPRYMSPEQCKSSARVDHRSDIYSLGCILYEMLVGKSPYEGDAGELIAKHQLAPIPRPRASRPELSAYLDVLISAMLAKDPADRPASMERVREALIASRDNPDAPEAAAPIETTMRGAAGEAEPRAHVRSMRWWLVAIVSMIPIGLALGYMLARSARTPHAAQAFDARVAIAADAGVDPGKQELACRKLAADRRWDDVLLCADELAKLVPAGTPAIRELTTMAVIETRNSDCFAKVETAAAGGDLAEASRWLDRIDDTSVYKEEATELVDKLAAAQQVVVPRRRPTCDADKLSTRAQQAITEGQYTVALSLLESSIRCRPDSSLFRLAVLAACNSSNEAKAKRYYAKLSAGQRTTMAQVCLRNGISLGTLVHPQGSSDKLE